jgi:hypothetical protein
MGNVCLKFVMREMKCMQNFATETLWKAATRSTEMEISVFVKMAFRGIGLYNVDSIELACDLMH